MLFAAYLPHLPLLLLHEPLALGQLDSLQGHLHSASLHSHLPSLQESLFSQSLHLSHSAFLVSAFLEGQQLLATFLKEDSPAASKEKAGETTTNAIATRSTNIDIENLRIIKTFHYFCVFVPFGTSLLNSKIENNHCFSIQKHTKLGSTRAYMRCLT